MSRAPLRVASGPQKPHEVELESEALERIAAALSDLYALLYAERPADARCSLTGNLLAYVFSGGLTVADEWLLRAGKPERLKEFRRHFFEVIDEEMVGVIVDLTGFDVTYSFYGFDPLTRTSHAIFVVGERSAEESEQRRAVLNWSEQVRRSARRMHETHAAARRAHHELVEEVRAQREQIQRDRQGRPEAR